MFKKIIVGLFVIASVVFADDISAYLVGKYQDPNSVKDSLKGAGFEVLLEYDVVDGGKSIVFTSKELKSEALKKDRGFIAVLRAYVDNKEGIISFTNPEYFGMAFMQDDYDKNVFKNLTDKIKSKFKNLKGSKDALEDDDLDHYHFMMGMPYYEDFEVLAEGSNSSLLEKAKKSNPLYILNISKDKYLVVFDLSNDTKKFVDKIGRKNGAILPYVVVIEGGEARALHPKFYIALSYPQLSMGTFMTISDIPGKILDELEGKFK